MGIAEEFARYQARRRLVLDDDMVIDRFKPVLDDIRADRYTEYVFSGGRGSAKSSFVSLALLERLETHPQMHALVCRQVQDTLKDSVYAQMQWAIEQTGRSDDYIFKTSPLEIIRKSTRQRIYFRGADDPVKIKSIKPPFGYIGILWFEELDQFRGDDAVRSIEQSAVRGGDKAYIFKSFNPPKSAQNWANKYIKIPKDTRLVTHNTYLDVPRAWLGNTFIEQAEFLRETKPEAYEHEYLGIANGTGGAVFDNVTIRGISRDEINIFDRVYHGVDWGWYPDPNRYVRMNYDKTRRKLYIYGELSCNKTSDKDFAKLMADYGVKKSDYITADRADNKAIGNFRAWGWNMHPAIKGAGSVEAGIKWLCSLDEIIIDNKRCPKTAEEFVNYEYERDREGNVISGYPDRDNHSIDAVRYALERVWRRRGK
jgi:phage terminase large subunit|nr:MAG TPA: terminase large subunit [Caudoviricetes sp.]